MKKSITFLLLIVSLFVVAQKMQDKKLTVSLTLNEWQQVLTVIDASSASHQQVKNVTDELVRQLQPQIKADTTKHK